MNAVSKISWVTNATDTAARDVSAEKVLEAIRTGGKELRPRVEQIRRLIAAGHRDQGSELKRRLPAVMWSGHFSERNNNALVKHSGLLCADLDSLNGELPSVREKLTKSPHVWSAFTSPSGEGLKAVFRVPADGARHAGSYRAVEQHVRELTGRQIDQSCKDVARLCFLSYDPEVYVNDSAREIEPLPQTEKAKANSNGVIPADLPLRERIATELLGPLTWSAEKGGYFCKCPGEASHTNGTAQKDAILYLDGSPTLSCQHNSCGRIVEAFNAQLRSRIGKAEAPAKTTAMSNRASRLLGVSPETGNGSKPSVTSVRQYAFTDLTKISAKAVEWVEEPYVARGEMHFLQGQGGSYKGTLALTWAAEFSRRGEHVLLVLAEDDLEKKVLPLLMAAGADIAFVHPLAIRCGENEDALDLPDDLGALQQKMAETQASLVIIDPLLSHVTRKLDAHRDHDMKRLLTPIGKLAQRMNAVIVCVHHTRKDTSGGMKMAGAGSIAFYTTARIVLTMAKLSEEEVVLEVVKSNLGPEGARQLLRAEIVEVLPAIKVPRLTRAGESPVGVAEALSGERKEKETKTLAAAKLILDILEEEGEHRQTELFDRVAEQTGLSLKTIRNKAYFGILVEEDLVESRKAGFKGGWLVARSDRERPQKLRSVTAKSNPPGYSSAPGYSSGVLGSSLQQQQGYSSSVSPSEMAKSNLFQGVRYPSAEKGYSSEVSAISATAQSVPGSADLEARDMKPGELLLKAFRHGLTIRLNGKGGLRLAPARLATPEISYGVWRLKAELLPLVARLEAVGAIDDPLILEAVALFNVKPEGLRMAFPA
jgi:hypothetical protein